MTAAKETKAESKSKEIQIKNSSGKIVGSKEVSAELFGVKAKKGLLNQVVRWQRAKARSGTHSVMTRAQMSGGGVKPWKQKGTGRARAGSNTSPLWVGGGVAHGPKVRSYEFSLNKQERKLALRSAVSQRSTEGRMFIVEDFGISKIKTKKAREVLDSLGFTAKDKVTVIVPHGSEALSLSLRNIKGVRVIEPAGLNVYDVLVSKSLVVVGNAFDALEARLK